MKHLVLCGFCVFCFSATSLLAAESFLVEDGKPKAEIVIAEDAVPVIRAAAEFLQSDIEKMSGAKLPIVMKPTGGQFVQPQSRKVSKDARRWASNLPRPGRLFRAGRPTCVGPASFALR